MLLSAKILCSVCSGNTCRWLYRLIENLENLLNPELQEIALLDSQHKMQVSF